MPIPPQPWLAEDDQTWRNAEFSSLLDELNRWKSVVDSNLELFKERVYDNPRPSELDFRQHRQRLYHLLAEGEAIAIKLMINGAKPPFYNDARLEKLARLLFEWHGPIEAQQDLPRSFKAAVRELKQGKIVESDF